MKFIFERLISRDLDRVYYVIIEPSKDRIAVYSQDVEALNKIAYGENKAKEYFELYTGLLKTTREELDYSLLEWKIPARSCGVSFNYWQVKEERKRRELEGLKTRVRLSR